MGEREPSHELFAKFTNFYSRPFKGRCCKLLLWTTFVISTIVDNQRSDNFRFPCEQPLSPTSLQIWPLRFCKQVIWNDKCLWRKIPRAGRTGQTGRTGQKGRSGRIGRRRIRRTFELDFASNLCRVAFAILVMFFYCRVSSWHIWPYLASLGAYLSVPNMVKWGFAEKILQNAVQTRSAWVNRTPQSKVTTKSNFWPISLLHYNASYSTTGTSCTDKESNWFQASTNNSPYSMVRSIVPRLSRMNNTFSLFTKLSSYKK